MQYTHSDEDPEMKFGLGNVERQTQEKMPNMFQHYKTETLQHEKQRDRLKKLEEEENRKKKKAWIGGSRWSQ
jgi:hypothetical protein